ncbi:Cytochrome P450 CYP301 [Frankliniella occidentalis]|uniref:Probable cytochrome P450 49a1 n=1 Tax=Frankliniella occidentalis TaxID=133901 RepID=A0A6J1SSC3_FRAOC|nr:probable cytochrome P450 49a1 [Frankliniella occidentalis]KAE8745658.1 Cytochrome P450 CYP301 [Frankliniella occidentalis]
MAGPAAWRSLLARGPRPLLGHVVRPSTSTATPSSAAGDDAVLHGSVNDVRGYDEVPGPRPVPFLGNSWRFLPVVGNYRIEQMDKVCLGLHRQYGDIVKVAGLLGRPDMVFVFDADLIEQVFRGEDALLPVRPSMPSLDAFKHGIRKDFFGDLAGVIAVHGPKWLEFRTRVQQVMLQPRTAKLYVGAIQDTADSFVRRVRRLRSPAGDAPPDFVNEIHKWSLESIARVALDARLGCLDDRPPADTQALIDAVNTFFMNVGVLELKPPLWKIFPTPTWKAYIRALDDITNITSGYITRALDALRETEHAELGPDASLLQRVLASHDARTAHILAIDLFLVGIDTTSAALSSALYQLALHPEQQEKLHGEVVRVLGPDGAVTASALEDMPYLRAVLKEVLRMYPVVIGNGRTLTEDTVVGGYLIPKGTQIIFQHYVASNQDRYFPEAGRFRPERWLREHQAACPAHPFASLPFGYGRRMCIGRRFAELELHTVVAKMVQNFRMEYNKAPLPYRVHPMYMPHGPLQLTLHAR